MYFLKTSVQLGSKDEDDAAGKGNSKCRWPSFKLEG